MIKDKQTNLNLSSQEKIVGHKKSVICCQNSKGTSFNTKGYFSSSQPYDEEYLKVKQSVYKKYRNGPQQLMVIDPKQTKPSFYIQRGLLKPINHQANNDSNKEKIINNFIKNYIHRKQKRQFIEAEKYSGSTAIIDIIKSDNPISKTVNTVQSQQINTKTARISGRSIFNREYTCKSNISNKQN